jgi:hypothetical protein
LWHASIITISASTVAPMAMAMPPRLMMVDGTPRKYMGMKAVTTASGRRRWASSALRRCSRNTRMTTLTTTPSSISALQRVDGAVDQALAIVGLHDLDARRQRLLQLVEPFLDALDDGARVLAVARDHDRADGLALAVELGQARGGSRPRLRTSATSRTRSGSPGAGAQRRSARWSKLPR